VPVSVEAPGSQIGPYKLLQQIGEGGMGTVYLAEQEEPVRRRVALKIIKAGMDSRQVIARFEAERQALSMMDHPNIAHVLDVGTTETGRPYFVMELVKGLPITTYCDEKGLTPKQRLGVFKSICHAVQHAHQKGIIHRDLKPNNILVTEFDNRAVPKIIDFGLAKALHQRLTEKTMFTQLGQVLGTLEYMSPEQSKMNQQDVDTRTDIYSLGVLLYELLTGTTPFDKQRLHSAAIDEVFKIIREEDPPKPSNRLSTLLSRPEIASRRGIEPKKLSGFVRGELDWIVMKTLEKDRARRYETANGLAADIQRYLDDQPVVASPPSASYRLRKFARRHRIVLTMAVVVAAALVGGLTVALYGLVQANRERALAVREAEKSEAISGFLNDMLSSVDPNRTLGEDVTVRTILDEAATRLDQEELAHQPAARAALLSSIGRSYVALGLFEDAKPHFAESLTLQEQILGPGHPDTAANRDDLALAHLQLGEYEQAEILYARAVEVREAASGPDAASDSVLGLADVLIYTGRHDEAEALLRQAVAAERRRTGDLTPGLARALKTLGLALEKKGVNDEAIRALRESVEIYRVVYGSPSTQVAEALSSLGAALEANSDLESAEEVHRESLQIRRQLLSPEHPSLGASLNNLGLVLSRLNKPEEAEHVLREALENRRTNYHTSHQATAATLNNLASALERLNRTEEALRYYEEAIRMATEALPTGHMMPAALRGNRAACLIGMQRFEEAEAELAEAHAILHKALGPEHRRTQKVVQYAIELYEAWGKPERLAEWRLRLAKEDL